MTDQKNTDEQNEVINMAVRGMGSLMMLGGVALAFNLGGIAGMLVSVDGFSEKLLGGLLFLFGVIDFFLVPKILETLRRK